MHMSKRQKDIRDMFQTHKIISSAAKRRSRHRALSKWGAFYELGVLRRLQASIQFV
jgi:hypothetical protein